MKAQRQNSTCSQGNICENVHWYIVIVKGRGGRREGRKKKRENIDRRFDYGFYRKKSNTG